MDLRSKVFIELKSKGFKAGYLWKFNQYLNSFIIRLSENEQKQFYNTMQQLCEEGVFTASPNHIDRSQFDYRLTQKGEYIINN